jgi:hypothetical protein
MTRRSLAVLAALLVGLIVYVGVQERRPAAGSSAAGQLLLPDLAGELDAVNRVDVTRGGGELVIAVERGPLGWVARNKADYPADIAKIRTALAAVAEARILEAKTANPELYDRLGVEPIDVADAAGLLLTIDRTEGESVAVLFGDEEGSDYRYARLPDQEQSYLVTANPELPTEAADWLDTALVDVPAARIREVVVEHADGERVRVYKGSPSEQHFSVEELPAERELLYVGVTSSMAGALTALRFEDVRGSLPERQADAVTRFRAFDGLALTVQSYVDGDDTWIAIDAAYDAEAATSADPAAAAVPEDASTPEAADGEAPATGATEAAASDPEAEARELEARFGDWQYRIPSYKAEQITRRLEDLLKAEP